MAQQLMRSRLRWLAVLAGIALISLTLVVIRALDTTCPPDWSGAQPVTIANNQQVPLGVPPISYRVHGDIARDFALKVALPRLGSQHPLVAVVTIQASASAEMESVNVSCVRLTHGDETWSRRPRTNDVTTSPGNPSAGAWRVSVADDGPEWEVGETVDLEIWVAVAGQRYAITLGPFTLYKGL